MEFDYDLITLGAGSGGTRASRFASSIYKAKVAVVELPFGFVSTDVVGGAGGTCVIRGCVPKKLLVYGSEFSAAFKDALGFGWVDHQPAHNWKALIQNKNKEIERLNGVYKNILKNAGCDNFEGRGVIIDEHTVEIHSLDGSSKRITGKNLLIATGSFATKLKIEGAEHCITSDEALVLDNLPESSVAVLGAGYIATEFAGIFSGLGCKVHLMFRGDKPLRGFDSECREQVLENLVKKGVEVHAGCNPTRVVKEADGSFTLFYKGADGVESSLSTGQVMMATGRGARCKNIGLEEVGVELTDSGAIKVDDYSRTNIPSIWSIGDVTNRLQLTPVALMEGMAVACSICTGELTKPDYLWVPCAVFAQPPMSTVGYSEEAAIEKLEGHIDVYVSKFKPMKYTICGRDERTLMKLIVHAETDRVVGCHMVGPDAPEIIQGLAIAVKMGATKADFDSTVGIHPSAAEEFVTMRTKTRTVPCTGHSKL